MVKVLVHLALYNGSKYWGKATFYPERAFITTEGGFSYATKQWEYRWKSNTPPFAGRLDSQLVSPDWIPPSFISAGTGPFGVIDTRVTQLLFSVAATQNQFKIIIPEFSVTCVRDGKLQSDGLTSPLVVELDQETTPSFPTSEYGGLTPLTDQVIQLADVGTLQFLGLSKEPFKQGTVLKLRFKFTNANAGYGVEASFDGYIIGNDGLARSFLLDFDTQDCRVSYTLGPGLSKDITLCTLISQDLDRLSLVIQNIILTEGGSGTKPVLQVYRIDLSSKSSSSGLGDSAELALQSEYFTVYPEDPIRPYVIVRNAGTNTWRADSYGYSARGEWADRWGNGKLWRDVRSGEIIEFVDKISTTAPKEIGTYYYGFMLVNDQGNEFGPFFFIRVNVVPKPENVGANELKLLAKLPVDPLRYKLNQQLSPAGYLDFLVIHSGSVFAKLFDILDALRTGVDLLSQPDKIEAAFYEDAQTHTCFAQITEYKGDKLLRQNELIPVPCSAVPTTG